MFRALKAYLQEVNSKITAICYNTGPFVMFSMITNIYNKKTKGPTLMEFFTATGKVNKFFFYNERCSMCAPRVTRHTSMRYSSSCHTHFFRFPVAVNNSIKVGPLVFLL
jgi:hypothetical protein